MEKSISDKRLITQAAYARMKGVSRARISQMIKEKKLTAVFINGAKLILLRPDEVPEKSVNEIS